MPASGECWTDAQCDEGKCIGAAPCKCGESCNEPVPGACQTDDEECTTDTDCPGGNCMAGPICADDCLPGDPSCCLDNQCVGPANECISDAECGDGTCNPGPICYPWCDPNDPTCCFTNTCLGNPCPGEAPTGCLFKGCPGALVCTITEECIPSACECNADQGWVCTDDCIGGVCQASACPGKNPQGCSESGCPAGKECKSTSECIPSSCICDEGLGGWSCSADCNGGVCK